MINISNITQKAVSVEGLEVVRDDLIERINSKVGIESGKGLSTNDLTDTLKTNYDAAYGHSISAHAPSSAQANVIESIKVNGAEQSVNSKSVNITVPTQLSSLSADSTHRLVTDSEKNTWNNKQDTLVADSDYLTPTTASNTYQSKVDGKGLSTNDYTTEDKNKLANIDVGAQVNSITGIKGNSEANYRTGNVNLTPENIGASPTNHGHSDLSEQIENNTNALGGLKFSVVDGILTIEY